MKPILIGLLAPAFLGASLISVGPIPVSGSGTFTSSLDDDGGYTLFLSGSSNGHTVRIGIGQSPAICCIFTPGQLLPLNGGMVYAGSSAYIDSIGSGRFLFEWDYLEIFDQITMAPLAAATLTMGGMQETSFSITGDGNSRISHGSFIVMPPDPPIMTLDSTITGVPEADSFWLCLTGLILTQTVLSTVKEKRV